MLADPLSVAAHLGRRHVVPRRPASACWSRSRCSRSRRGRRVADVFDFAAPLPAIGFGAGRIGNFINGELWGKPTDVPWAVVVDGVPLHASQLYEAVARGPGAVRDPVVVHVEAAAALGAVGPVPASATACSASRSSSCACRTRTAATCCFDWVTMGQILSLPMIVAGLCDARSRVPPPAAVRQLRLTHAAIPRPAAPRARARRAQDRPHRHRHARRVRLADALRPAARASRWSPPRSCT